MSKLDQIIRDILDYVDDLPEKTGRAGVFDRGSERYQLACALASYALGGLAKGMKHPDADGEPLVRFLMPWEQDGNVGCLLPLFRQGTRLYMLGGARAPGLPRAGLFNWAGQGFKQTPKLGLPMPPNQGVLTALDEWHDETGNMIPLQEDELLPLGDVSLRGQYGGMFPGRDTCSLVYSALFDIDDMDAVLAALKPTTEFASFAFVEMERALDAEHDPVDGMGWAFPYGDPVVASYVLRYHQRYGLPKLGFVDARMGL